MKARFFCSLFILCTCFVFWSSAHGLMKRDAGEGKFYVFSSRKGCVSVASAEPCPVNWKLNTDVAKSYETLNNLVNSSLKEVDLAPGVSEQCRNDVKATLCSRFTPRCFEDGGKDYGNAKKMCEKLYRSCSEAAVKSLKEERLCDTSWRTGARTGVHPKGDCVSPPRLVKGVCPQPKHKMTLDHFTAYENRSEALVETFKIMEKARYPDDHTRIFSSECMSKLEEMLCIRLYCSADEKSLLIKHDRADCKNVMKSCFDAASTKLSAYPSMSQLAKQLKQTLDPVCNLYPDAATTETQSAPPTVRPPTSSANSHLPQLVLLLFLVFSMIFSAYDEF